MQSRVTSAGDANAYNLLHLLTEAGRGGRPVQHFVCLDCLELVEKRAGSTGGHRCREND